MSDNLFTFWSAQRRSDLSLSFQLAEYLRAAIHNGKLPPGKQLPSETELALQLQVSRPTLRDAVQQLCLEGLLDRRRGVGTFVTSSRPLIIGNNIAALLSTTRLIRQSGYEPGTLGLRSEVIPATPLLSKALQIPVEAPVLHISRTRTANAKPVIHNEEYLPLAILDSRSLPTDKEDWSLYQLLTSVGRIPSYCITKLKCINAEPNLARQLQVPVNFALLWMGQTIFTADDCPVLYAENFHNTAIIDFQVLRR